jgi:hypothetical protein
MLKRRILKLAIAVITVAGSAGGLAVAGSGTALAAPHAAAQAATKAATQVQTHAAVPQVAAIDTYTCFGHWGTTSRYCYAHVYSGAILYKRSGGVIYLNSNEGIKVTCWYYGNTSDGYWDHVTWTSNHGSVTGHVDDGYVNFGGNTPPNVGLHSC